ncbi:DUF4263 domain-containing protein [Rhizobium leguminosarum bv. viciae]|uniref:Shedu anti-phage system protein SduA domain-containing protein n=1 Tax=Rhizobium ruizarguesonis TaxID=2081791 RepID=UPI00143F4FAF|nr:Shedu anti-phage system protein SduA domain-containing protein [Rhizobium ruizarguesonis]NKJ72813.1 DUF4263 domain-containing protein [Rhizobium leguminosarum bv. viciae]NKQ80495.1 hypothetical protein [Rhizobium ruizarguesonis]
MEPHQSDDSVGYYWLADQFGRWSQFHKVMTNTLEHILADLEEVYEFKSRVKSLESITAKANALRRHSLKHLSEEVPDIVGFRIVVFFQSQIETVLNRISEELDVVSVNRQFDDHEQIKNCIIIAKLNDKRLQLPEWSAFEGQQFEIQILTVIAVAQLDIDHALRYKADVPRIEEKQRSRTSPIQTDLSLLDQIVDNFSSLISRIDVHEKRDVHAFIKSHPFILHPNAMETFSEVAIGLGTEHRLDFLIREADNSYVLVEIENPQHRLFTSNGDFTAAVNHAQRQVEDWQQWIEENMLLVQKRYPDMLSPRGLVVIGRGIGLSDVERTRLSRRNANLRGQIAIKTYDDLIAGARQSIASMRKAIVDAGLL